MKKDICEIKSCKNFSDYFYYNRGVCEHHWSMHCDSSRGFDLKKYFKIKEKKKKIKKIKRIKKKIIHHSKVKKKKKKVKKCRIQLNMPQE